MSQQRWMGQSVLVTGGGTGIGRAVSLELARRGALVYVSALTEEEAQRVVDDIETEGNQAKAIALDVTDDSRYREVIEQVAREQGSIDLLVNNAGVIYVGEFHEMEEGFLRKLIDVNFTAVAIGTLHGYRVMKAQGHGMIANVASQGGLMPVGTMAAYSGTKHGVVGLTASVAGEAEAHGVEFRTICPGNVASEMLSKATTRGTDAQGVLDTLPKLMSAEDAAVIVVDGLSRKPRKIIFPWYSRLLNLLTRLWPEFGHKGAVHSIAQFRERRNDQLNQG